MATRQVFLFGLYDRWRLGVAASLFPPASEAFSPRGHRARAFCGAGLRSPSGRFAKFVSSFAVRGSCAFGAPSPWASGGRFVPSLGAPCRSLPGALAAVSSLVVPPPLPLPVAVRSRWGAGGGPPRAHALLAPFGRCGRCACAGTPRFPPPLCPLGQGCAGLAFARPACPRGALLFRRAPLRVSHFACLGY